MIAERGRSKENFFQFPDMLQLIDLEVSTEHQAGRATPACSKLAEAKYASPMPAT